VTAGTKATTRLHTAESARPIGRKYRAFERSEMVAMKNLDSPYATSTALAIRPTPILSIQPSSRTTFAIRGMLFRIR